MPQPELLSERELEILNVLVTGASNREIARTLNISPNTVKVHLRNVYEKLDVSSRTEASLVALQEGLVSVEGVGSESDGLVPDSPSGELLSDASSTDAPRLALSDANEASRPTTAVEPETVSTTTSRGLPGWLGIALGTAALLTVILLVVLVLRPPSAEAPGREDVAMVDPPERWRPLAQLPAPRAGAVAVTTQQDVFLIGGGEGEVPSGPVLRYDHSVGRWDTVAPLPQPVTEGAVALAGGQLFVVGGLVAENEPTTLVQQYDLTSGEWGPGPPLPMPLARGALAAYEGTLYLFGGWDGEAAQSGIYRLRAGEGAWEPMGALDAPRMSLAATPLVEGIVLLGGQESSGEATADVTFFDPLSGELRNEAPLPTPMDHPRATTLGTALYVLDEGVLLERRPQGEWQALTTPDEKPLPDRAALVSQDPYLIVVGGTEAGSETANVWQYQAVYRSFLPFGTSP